LNAAFGRYAIEDHSAEGMALENQLVFIGKQILPQESAIAETLKGCTARTEFSNSSLSGE
jgi:hypothetical protein